MAIPGILSLFTFLVAATVAPAAILLASPERREALSARLRRRRGAFWDYCVETAAAFLAAVLTHPDVEPLVTNAISKGVDTWVGQQEATKKYQTAVGWIGERREGTARSAEEVRDKIVGKMNLVRGGLMQHGQDDKGGEGSLAACSGRSAADTNAQAPASSTSASFGQSSCSSARLQD